MTEQERDATTLEQFQASAEPAARRETVNVTLDADALASLQAKFPDWQGQINGLLRFFYDTSANRAASFDPDAFDPGEMAADPPLALEFA